MSPQSIQHARQVLDRFYGSIGTCQSLAAATNGRSGAVVLQVAAGQQRWALRRWPADGPRNTEIEQIHAVLAHAVEGGVDFVPAPLASESGDTLVAAHGARWELAPWMPGQPREPGPDAAPLLVAARALARFHQATINFAGQRPCGPSPAIASRRHRLSMAANVDWASLAAAGAATPGGSALGEVFSGIAQRMPQAIGIAQPLVDAVAGVEVPLQPVVRDARAEHFLFTGERVTGLVDFGAMTVDSTAVDFARLLGDWAGDDALMWTRCLSDLGLAEPTARLLAPLDASGVVLSCGNWLRWAAEGRSPDVVRIERLASRLRRLCDRG